MRLMHVSPKFKQYFSLKYPMFFWYRHYKALFFLGFLVVLGCGAFFWYQTLYRYQWSEEKKKAFSEQHFKETNFKEEAFQETVAHLKERAQKHEQSLVFSRDIFFKQP